MNCEHIEKCNLEIETTGTRTKILLNGKPIRGCYHADINLHVQEEPEVFLYIHPRDMKHILKNADVHICEDEEQKQIPVCPAFDPKTGKCTDMTEFPCPMSHQKMCMRFRREK